MQEEMNAQLRGFADQLTKLVYPVNRLVMDPLVVSAHSFVERFGHEGGKQVVGCVETQILRSRADQKYALYLLVDALCRARGSPRFSFKDNFALNLESIFASAYAEADDMNKDKLMRLLGIWMKKLPHELVFDMNVLGRTKARVDPSFHYRGPPVPAPVIAPPPPMPAYYPAAAVPPPMMMGPPPPVMPPPQELVFDIAERLLRKIFSDQNIPVHQQMSLRQLCEVNQPLYQTLMGQASQEAMQAMSRVGGGFPPPAPMPSHLSPPLLPSHLSPPLLPSPFAAAPPVAATTITPPAAMGALNDQTVSIKTERTVREIEYMVTTPAIPKAHELHIPADHVAVRGWMPRADVWISGEPAPCICIVRLFEEDPSVEAAERLKMEAQDKLTAAATAAETQLESSVPKDDSQKTCPLSGETFETFWDDDKQTWMYKQAIRPDANGPIYRLEAWLAQNPENESEFMERQSNNKRARFG